MSYRVFNETTAPSTPAAGKISMYADSADEKIKVIDDQGFVACLTPDGWREQNKCANGDFGFAQRQVPTTLTNIGAALAGGRQYSFDRFFISNSGGSAIPQTQQVTNVAGAEAGLNSAQYLKIKNTGATSKIFLGQVLEVGDCTHLNGSKVRVQMKMKYSVAASMVVRLGLVYMTSAGTADTILASAAGFISAVNGTGVDPTLTAAANLAYATPLITESTGTIVGNGVDCTLTNGWVRYSATFTVPATAKNLIPCVWTNAAIAINDELNVAEFGLYAGEEVRDWHPLMDGVELSACQRFYQKSFPLLIAPAAAVAVATGGTGRAGIIGKAGATALAVKIPIVFNPPLRITPTLTLFTPVGAGAVPYRIDGTTPAVQTSVAQVGLLQTGVTITATGDAAGAVGDLVGVHYTADAEI